MSKSNPLWWPKPPVIMNYGIAVLSVTAALIIARWMETVLQSAAHVSLFVCAVMLSAWFGGVGPGLLAIALSILAFDYYFLAPIYSLAVEITEIPRLLIYALSALFVGSLSVAQRSTAQSLRRARDDLHGTVQELKRTNEALQAENAERQQAQEALRQRASLLDLTHDTVFVRDMHDVITYWNRGAEELYGWTSEEAIGQVTHQLTRTIFPAPLEAINEELLRTGRWEGELIHTRRDGTRVVVASRWALQLDERGNPIAILETNNNITERKQAEEALRKHREQLEELVAERTRELSTLLETSNTIASTLELQPLLRVVLDQLKVVVQYTGATILSLEGEDLVVLGHSGPLSAEQIAQLRLPAAHTVGYQAVRRRGGSVIVDDVQSDSPQARAFRESGLADRYALSARSLLLVPLIVRERLIGMLRIESSEPGFYTERDAQLALAFANQAVTAIENARLYDRGVVGRRAAQLRRCSVPGFARPAGRKL